jgi:hypothetical protein
MHLPVFPFFFWSPEFFLKKFEFKKYSDLKILSLDDVQISKNLKTRNSEIHKYSSLGNVQNFEKPKELDEKRKTG